MYEVQMYKYIYYVLYIMYSKIYPLNQGGGGGVLFTFHSKYLKILDLANLFVADDPMKKKSRNLVLPPSQSTLKYGSENCPWVRGLNKIPMPPLSTPHYPKQNFFDCLLN